MSTPEERKENHEMMLKMTPLAANGDPYAAHYLHSMAFLNRVIDDLYDRDVEVPRETIIDFTQVAFIDLPENPFYRKHFVLLQGMFAVIFNLWVDANRQQESEDKLDQMYGHVYKDFISELWPLVAKLTGGYDHMRRVSLLVRETIKEELPNG
jgi:hypothetical protein